MHATAVAKQIVAEKSAKEVQAFEKISQQLKRQKQIAKKADKRKRDAEADQRRLDQWKVCERTCRLHLHGAF